MAHPREQEQAELALLNHEFVEKVIISCPLTVLLQCFEPEQSK